LKFLYDIKTSPYDAVTMDFIVRHQSGLVGYVTFRAGGPVKQLTSATARQ